MKPPQAKILCTEQHKNQKLEITSEEEISSPTGFLPFSRHLFKYIA
jgi:hypothetical protein